MAAEKKVLSGRPVEGEGGMQLFESVRALVEDLGAKRASPMAQALLEEAADPAPRMPRVVSSTRLLLACAAIVARSPAEAASAAEPALAVFAHLIGSGLEWGGALARLRNDYLDMSTPQPKLALGIALTANARAMLAWAVERSGPARDGPVLRADAILAAVLTQARGNLAARAARQGLQLDALAEAVVQRLGADADLRLWPAGSRLLIAGQGSDDPWQGDLHDSLGTAVEAEAFAAVAAARRTDPPLAIGVFGEWGMGKSFFLRLVHEHVMKFAKSGSDGQDGFHRDIVQIRFNAWHYVDTHLWASLVDHIFVQLDAWLTGPQGDPQARLLNGLTTARELTLEAAERLVQQRLQEQAARQALVKARSELADAQVRARASPATFWRAVGQQLAATLSREDRQRLEQAAQTLGIAGLAEEARVLESSLRALRSQQGRARLFWRGFLAQGGRKIYIGAFLALVLLLPALLVGARAVWDAALPALASPVGNGVAALSGVLAAAAVLLRRISLGVGVALDGLEGCRTRFEAAVAEASRAEHQSLKASEAEVVKSQAALDEAQAHWAAMTVRLRDAEVEYEAGSGRGRLLKLVRERAADGSYAKHLGVIGAIRKDFEQLAAGLAGERDSEAVQAERKAWADAFDRRVEDLKRRAERLRDDGDAKPLGDDLKQLDLERDKTEQPPRSPSRIVLYIDDLDRCPPEKVAEVLQAVHLLLTFRLFVVFVAIDVRWVGRALETHYAGMLGRDTGAAAGALSVATAHDYLEKIFQIPYWVRPMAPEACGRLLLDRQERFELAPRQAENEVGPAGGDGPGGGSGTGTDAPPAPPSPQPDIAAEEASELLKLTASEHAFMARLAPFVASSPRRAVRFLNVYRVLRASRGRAARANDEASLRALMAHVAVVTGAPSLARRWFGAISASPPPSRLRDLTQRLGIDEAADAAKPSAQVADEARLHGVLAALGAEPGPEGERRLLAALGRHADAAQRFRFDA